MTPKPIRRIATPARAIVAICGKCGKKLGGGFGPHEKQSLAKALARALDLPKPKQARLRIVETACLKLCPKNAVAVLHSGDPGAIFVVPRGSPVLEIASLFDARLNIA